MIRPEATVVPTPRTEDDDPSALMDALQTSRNAVIREGLKAVERYLELPPAERLSFLAQAPGEQAVADPVNLDPQYNAARRAYDARVIACDIRAAGTVIE